MPIADDAMGLGRVEGPQLEGPELGEVAIQTGFPCFDYAWTAAIRVWMLMIFITRVRL
jgi:hypothetical protein